MSDEARGTMIEFDAPSIFHTATGLEQSGQTGCPGRRACWSACLLHRPASGIQCVFAYLDRGRAVPQKNVQRRCGGGATGEHLRARIKRTFDLDGNAMREARAKFDAAQLAELKIKSV